MIRELNRLKVLLKTDIVCWLEQVAPIKKTSRTCSIPLLHKIERTLDLQYGKP